MINDLDPAIYAFWYAVINEPIAFSRLINKATLNLDEWARQREIYLTAARDDYLKLGFATFYLNRTNRSGALNGGVIGGRKQVGRYKIDARFNKSTLMERVRLIGIHAKRIRLVNADGLAVIKEFASDHQALIYADPPYFDRSGSLYLNAFTEENHVALATMLNDLTELKWLLTYDNVPRVHELYSARRREVISLNYSAHRVLKALSNDLLRCVGPTSITICLGSLGILSGAESWRVGGCWSGARKENRAATPTGAWTRRPRMGKMDRRLPLGRWGTAGDRVL